MLFSDIPDDSFLSGRKRRVLIFIKEPSGYSGSAQFEGKDRGSNGHTFDSLGRLVLFEHGDRRISRLEQNITRTSHADSYKGKRLNSPNEALFKSNGDLFITDPPFGSPETLNDPLKELPLQSVYRLPSDGTLKLLTKVIKAPNGIVFSSDEKILYVTDIYPNRSVWLEFDVKDDGTLTNRCVL